MKTRFLILIATAVAVTILFTVVFENRYGAISAFYSSFQTSDPRNLCFSIGGKWDPNHDTCDNVEYAKCLAVGGKPLTKPHEWRCPQGVDDCAMHSIDIDTCHFEEFYPGPVNEDGKMPTIEIFQGNVLGDKTIEIIGWTNRINQDVTLTIAAPNGDLVSSIQTSPMVDGEFAAMIVTSGSIWKEQDGVYTVTAQLDDDQTQSASLELNLKNGNIVTRE